MEARSLATLNYTAANPPQYPVNPTEQRQDPLTLYISRVPGTRDVILSPFKPQLKNVTSEDVANSLYYIHFDTTKPDLQEPPRIGHYDASSDEGSPSRNIPRKPVGGEPQTTTDDRQLPFLDVALPTDEQDGQTRRSEDWFNGPPPTLQVSSPTKPLEDSGVGLNEAAGSSQPDVSHLPALQTQIPARKPLGPRSIADTSPASTVEKVLPVPASEEPFSSSERPYSQQSYHERSDQPDWTKPHEERPWSQQGLPKETEVPPPPPPHDNPVNPPSASADGPPPPIPRRPVQSDRPRSPSPAKKASETFNLNLIRRDPSSNSQWNVARITSQHFDASTAQASEDGTPVARPAIDVQIETSGYAKFRNMPARRSLDASAPEVVTEEPSQAGSNLFSRQVVMSYSKSWSSGLKQKLNRLNEQRQAHARGESHGSVASALAAANESEPTTAIGQPGPGMKPRGYVFNSPWDGRCEFRTGNGGRSLRCNHILHEGPAATFNPLVSDQQGAGNSPPSPPAAVVSELRFNLPSSELLGSDEAQRGAQRLGNLRKFWKRDEDEDEDDDEVSPFDVNVGKERAGGGNRGKRAKLGKLIIYSEGVKMLDLIVAANMGVWWGAWERTF